MDKKNYKPSVEINGPQFGLWVERAGYRSAKSQIEAFIYAGEMLKSSRESSFDTDDEDPVEDHSILIRDMELSEIGMLMSEKQFEAPKGVYKGETGASVSPSEEQKVEADKVEA